MWVSQEAILAWIPARAGNRGGQPLYSDVAIETGLSLRLIFHLGLRQTEGFLRSLLKLMGVDLPCPDHTTFSRRNHAVEVGRHSENLPAGPINFIVDSTGLKICGQGEWHARMHGKRQRRRWRKLHLGVDGEGWIHASKITDDHEQDPCQVPDLLDQVEREINSFVGDGIYDRDSVYEAVMRHSPLATLIVPPRKDAVVSSRANTASSQRDRHVRGILKMGRSKWKRESGYYLQSHAENAIFRYKATFGGRLRAKRNDAQEKEVVLGCFLLNRMRQMGHPLSYAVQ